MPGSPISMKPSTNIQEKYHNPEEHQQMLFFIYCFFDFLLSCPPAGGFLAQIFKICYYLNTEKIKKQPMNLRNISISFFIMLFVVTPVLPALAAEFDPNFIVSDAEINDYNSMTLAQIEAFLREKDSYLTDYKCEDIDGNMRKAPEIIHTLAQENKINPKFMLVLLQKEQSLVEDPSPSAYQLRAATGYGCPDGGNCNPRWAGLYRQINSAYLQFRSYLDEAYLYRYKTGNTYIFNNSIKSVKTIDIVTPKNQATAALYNYTPHVYYGNYNFWNLWNKYFPVKKTFFPDGSLLRAEGEAGIYLIQNGEKRPFLSKSALLSRFSLDKVVDVSANDLDAYAEGTPIRFPNYSILRSPDKKLYLLVDDVKREIPSMEIFKKIGFNETEIINAKNEEIKDYITGKTVSTEDAYPTGALVQNTKTGGVYFVINSVKYPIWNKIIMEINYPNKKIVPSTPEELAKYENGAPVKLKDGELIKSPNSPVVYVISNGEKRPIANEKTFLGLGYKWVDIKEVNDKVMEIHLGGKEINIDADNEFEIALVK